MPVIVPIILHLPYEQPVLVHRVRNSAYCGGVNQMAVGWDSLAGAGDDFHDDCQNARISIGSKRIPNLVRTL